MHKELMCSYENLINTLLHASKDQYQSKLETYAHYSERIKKKFLENAEEYHKQFIHSYKTVIKKLKRRHLPVDDYKLTKERLEVMHNSELYRQTLQEGATPQEMLNYSMDQVCTLYKIASTLYKEGHLSDAQSIFLYLIMLNPFVASFWIGLGASHQAESKFDDALAAYGMAMMVDPTAWEPIAYSINGLLVQGKAEEAIHLLDHVLQHALSTEEGNIIKAKALEAKEHIIHLPKTK